MKFIHLSDTRIGNSAECGTPWEEARLIELEGGISRVMTEAGSMGVDLVIISGGLFANKPATAELDNLSDLFSAYPGIHVVIISGETDSISKSSPINSYSWPGNVHYVIRGSAKRIVISDIGTEILASSVTDFENTVPEQLAIAALEDHQDEQPVKIAVLRSDDDEKIKEVFSDAGFSYVAVGSSVPGRKIISENAACPGFFEPKEMGDSGQHGVYTGVISATGKLEKLEFKPMAAASYIPLLIRTSVKTTSDEVEMLVRNEILRRGVKNIYRLKISGSRSPYVKFNLDGLRRVYRISEVIDETEPEYDFRELFAEHPQDMIGFYISRIINDNHEMSPVEKKAMFYGLDALLNTTDNK